MTDIEIAKGTIDGHSVCFCKDGKSFTLDGMGLSPLMRMINEGKDLHGYSAADVVVGKAAAMLFKKLGVVSVHGKLMSETGADFLENRGSPSLMILLLITSKIAREQICVLWKRQFSKSAMQKRDLLH